MRVLKIAYHFIQTPRHRPTLPSFLRFEIEEREGEKEGKRGFVFSSKSLNSLSFCSLLPLSSLSLLSPPLSLSLSPSLPLPPSPSPPLKNKNIFLSDLSYVCNVSM